MFIAGAVGANVVDDAGVHIELADRGMLQIGQGSVTSAKAVRRYAHAQVVERLQLGHDPLPALRQPVFVNFQPHCGCFEARLAQPSEQLVCEVVLFKRQP